MNATTIGFQNKNGALECSREYILYWHLQLTVELQLLINMFSLTLPLCFLVFNRNADYTLPRQTADCGMCTPAAVFRRSTKIFLGHDMFISFMTWFILFVNTFKFHMTRSSLSPHCLFAASRRYVNNFGPCFEMHTQVTQVHVSGKL